MPSSETNSSSASQGIRCILWDLNVHYYVHNNQPLDPILSQIKSFPSYFISLKSMLILSSYLLLCHPLVTFPTKTLYKFFFFPYELHALPIQFSMM